MNFAKFTLCFLAISFHFFIDSVEGDCAEETWEECQKKYPNFCVLPSYTGDENLIINCDSSSNARIFPTWRKDIVPELTLISLPSSSYDVAIQQQCPSVCLQGNWTPQFSDCIRTCEPLHIADNTEILCYLNDQEVECKNQHLAGTAIRARCQSNLHPNTEEAVCHANGRWNVEKVECLECGWSRNGNTENMHPWNVKIHTTEDMFDGSLGDGTILSPNIVITAASCFNDRDIDNAGNYLKVSINQRDYEIQKIHIHENFQMDTNTNDIAIIELADKIKFNSNVHSVCIDWDPESHISFKGNSTGRVKQPTQKLVGFPLAYISRDACVNVGAGQAREFTNNDKFCVRMDQRDDPRHINTGTGFVVEKDQKYYLKGVASGVFSSAHTFRVFTDISKHLAWITPFLNTPEELAGPSNVPVWEKMPGVIAKDNMFVYDSLRISCSNGDMYREFVDGCSLPSRSRFKIDYNVTCAENIFQSYCNQSTVGAAVPQHTSLQYKCGSGFASYSLNNPINSVCIGGRWTPPISECIRVCKPIKQQNGVLQCSYDGYTVNCDDELIVNTKVRTVSCQPGYKMNITADFALIYCRGNGEWSGKLPECVPICGHPSKDTGKTTIHWGDPVFLGELPWHAAIYERSRNNTLICGATIVSAYALISAAHCFYNGNQNIQRIAIDYEVGVGKVSLDRLQTDSETTQFYEVESLIFNNFRGRKFRYQRDIVIIVTKNKILFNSQVSPICLFQDPGIKIPKDTLVDVAGWGVDETDHLSLTLKKAHLPYLSYDDCSQIDVPSISDFLATDKFCVGSHNASALDQGDSGGGLVLRSSSDSSYYLVGVVSARIIAGTSVSLCTDVLVYHHWINSNLNEIHRKKN